MQSYPEVQRVLEGQGGRRWSKLSHIPEMNPGVLEALVVLVGQPVLIYHSLGCLVSPALQDGLVDQRLIRL